MGTICNWQLFNPCSKDFHSIKNFKQLTCLQKTGISLVITCIACTIIGLLVITPTFRLLVGYCHAPQESTQTDKQTQNAYNKSLKTGADAEAPQSNTASMNTSQSAPVIAPSIPQPAVVFSGADAEAPQSNTASMNTSQSAPVIAPSTAQPAVVFSDEELAKAKLLMKELSATLIDVIEMSRYTGGKGYLLTGKWNVSNEEYVRTKTEFQASVNKLIESTSAENRYLDLGRTFWATTRESYDRCTLLKDVCSQQQKAKLQQGYATLEDFFFLRTPYTK